MATPTPVLPPVAPLPEVEVGDSGARASSIKVHQALRRLLYGLPYSRLRQSTNLATSHCKMFNTKIPQSYKSKEDSKLPAHRNVNGERVEMSEEYKGL
jgi:hypothetical protein